MVQDLFGCIICCQILNTFWTENKLEDAYSIHTHLTERVKNVWDGRISCGLNKKSQLLLLIGLGGQTLNKDNCKVNRKHYFPKVRQQL